MLIKISLDKVTVYLSGEIDHHEAARLRPQIDDALLRKRPTETELDFSDVTFIDSSAIGLVMGRFRIVEAWSGKIAVSGLTARQKRVMKLAGLDRIAEFRESEKGDNGHESGQQNAADGSGQVG
ncbi:MAG TPA: anti-sigma factor antagonist [Oscillospiraceae bacterium]|nr:anti-sigma factor antagonist [Oscillospiraceae bacterium]HPF55893.1 anti-sigma factor antagonist [Clostridiales bacterium]HPK35018.1 anti-sigma factor antagonist [Oscillospiraceae bacterium]HPR76267.1 anti-sigma factor antagonist [Oscillospiraceae bacterium]